MLSKHALDLNEWYHFCSKQICPPPQAASGRALS